MTSKLLISDLRIWVHLGCGEEEKHHSQAVSISIEFTFKTDPAALYTDRIEDTICYLELTQKIEALLNSKRYNLIEHLAKSIHREACDYANQSRHDVCDISVYLRKISPPVPGVHGGVTFIYSGAP